MGWLKIFIVCISFRGDDGIKLNLFEWQTRRHLSIDTCQESFLFAWNEKEPEALVNVTNNVWLRAAPVVAAHARHARNIWHRFLCRKAKTTQCRMSNMSWRNAIRCRTYISGFVSDFFLLFVISVLLISRYRHDGLTDRIPSKIPTSLLILIFLY